MALEVLHLPLMPFGSGARLERSETAPLAGLRIDLAGIQPVFAGAQLADHGRLPMALTVLNGSDGGLVPAGATEQRSDASHQTEILTRLPALSLSTNERSSRFSASRDTAP